MTNKKKYLLLRKLGQGKVKNCLFNQLKQQYVKKFENFHFLISLPQPPSR